MAMIPMGKPMGIMAIHFIVWIGISLAINLATGVGIRGLGGPGGRGAAPGLSIMLLGMVAQYVLGFLVLVGLIKSMLPTKFGRAFAVAGLFCVIALAILAVIGVVLGLVIGLGAAGGWGR
jgi:hypothetical protein